MITAKDPVGVSADGIMITAKDPVGVSADGIFCCIDRNIAIPGNGYSCSGNDHCSCHEGRPNDRDPTAVVSRFIRTQA